MQMAKAVMMTLSLRSGQAFRLTTYYAENIPHNPVGVFYGIIPA
jgi:hypothetical protein